LFSMENINFITSSEIRKQLPLLTGAAVRETFCQMSDNEIDWMLPKNALRQFARYSSIDIIKYKKYAQRG